MKRIGSGANVPNPVFQDGSEEVDDRYRVDRPDSISDLTCPHRPYHLHCGEYEEQKAPRRHQQGVTWFFAY